MYAACSPRQSTATVTLPHREPRPSTRHVSASGQSHVRKDAGGGRLSDNPISFLLPAHLTKSFWRTYNRRVETTVTATLALADPQGRIYGLVFAALVWGAVGGDQCADGFDDDPGGEQVEADRDQPLRAALGLLLARGVPVNRQMTMMLASASILLSRLNRAGRPGPVITAAPMAARPRCRTSRE